MNYIINVAKPNGLNWDGTKTKYVHYFKAVASFGTYKEVYEDLVKSFPDCEVTVWRQETISTSIEMKGE